MKIELNCPRCGNNHFSFPRNAEDSSVIRCADCGEAIGTFGELKDKIGAEVLGRSVKPKR